MNDLKIKLFLSYSHKDEPYCIELRKHLQPLKRAGIITDWFDREIRPGTSWNDTIIENLISCDIVLFLVSPDFLSSDYINDYEIKLSLERHHKGQCVVIPVMLRKCDIEFTQFKDIQGLPTDLQPVNSKGWFSADDAFFNIIEGLKKVILHERSRKAMVYEEESLWKDTVEKDTIEAYLFYLRNTKLKSKIEEVVNKLGKVNVPFSDTDHITLLSKLEIMEQDRVNISRELHDNIGQVLAVVKLTCNSIEMPADTADLLNKLLWTAMHDLRSISHGMLDGSIGDDFNLKGKLLEMESYIIGLGILQLDLQFLNVEKIINPHLSINIYRIIQELFNNILKHAHAKKACIVLKFIEDRIFLSVTDDGNGFLEKQTDTTGIGLRNIKDRVAYYKGECKIQATPGTGTSVVIVVPA